MPAQRLSTGELVFSVHKIPPFGSAHYRVVKGNSSFNLGCKIDGSVMENEKLKVSIDKNTGNIVQLIDKSTGYNYVAQKKNGINTFWWLPANQNAPVSDSSVHISIKERGPLVVEMEVYSLGKGVRSVVRRVRLIAGKPWVEIVNTVDKLPLKEKDGIHFGFAFHIPNGLTRYDIPWGVVQIEKDQWPQANRNWMTVQRWLDISNEQLGITWCSLDAPLFEYGKMSANIEVPPNFGLGS